MKNNKYKIINTAIEISKWVSYKNKINVIKLALLSILVGLSEVVSLISIKPILNIFNDKNNIDNTFFLGSNPNNLLLLLALSYALMLCLISFFKIKAISYGNFLSANIGQEIGKNLLENFLGQDFFKHLNRDSSIVINTFTIHLTQTVKFITFFLQILVSFFCTVYILIFIVFENPIVIIGTFISVGLGYIIIAKKIKAKNLMAANKSKSSMDQITKLMKEITSDIEKNILEYKDIEIIKEFSISDKAVRLSNANGRNYTSIPRYIIEVIAISTFLILTMIYALFFKLNNIILIAKLSASLLGLQKLLPSINLMYQSWNMMNYCMPSIYSVKDLISEEVDNNRIENSSKKIQNFKYSIVLSNINFGYEKEKNIFNNFNLEIKKGDKILIKGKSGKGKSTLIRIICGLIKPAKGQILIDNKFLGKEISYSNWQRQIGLVRQKPYLKSGNLLNLILGKQININKKNALKEAKYFAKLACIEEFIESLPFGYMQHINEDGNTLSGGQIQRIAIASTLALKPSILILDESTSGVDKATETSFFENIFKLENLTVIAISHSSNVERLFSKKIIF